MRLFNSKISISVMLHGQDKVPQLSKPKAKLLYSQNHPRKLLNRQQNSTVNKGGINTSVSYSIQHMLLIVFSQHWCSFLSLQLNIDDEELMLLNCGVGEDS